MGSGVRHECHELGHGTSPDIAMCLARYDECLAACPVTDGGGHGGDAQSGDAAGAEPVAD